MLRHEGVPRARCERRETPAVILDGRDTTNYVIADKNGIFEGLLEPGAAVQAGDPVGRLWFPDRDPPRADGPAPRRSTACSPSSARYRPPRRATASSSPASPSTAARSLFEASSDDSAQEPSRASENTGTTGSTSAARPSRSTAAGCSRSPRRRLVLQLTGSAVAVGALALAQLLPVTLLGLFVGTLIDRFEVRRVAICTEFGSW